MIQLSSDIFIFVSKTFFSKLSMFEKCKQRDFGGNFHNAKKQTNICVKR